MSYQTDTQASHSPSEQTEKPLREAASGVFNSMYKQLATLIELLTLELQYSGLMLASAIVISVMAGLAMFSLWGLLLASTAVWLLASGWSWAAALAALAAANALLMLMSFWLIRRSLGRVGIDNTRQALGLSVSDAAQ